jgi:hypothetical protein
MTPFTEHFKQVFSVFNVNIKECCVEQVDEVVF